MPEIFDLSDTDASNTVRFPEGMLGGQINNGARALEGMIARDYHDRDSGRTSAGSSNAYTVSSARTIVSLFNNLVLAWTASFTCTGASTLNLNTIGAKSIKRPNGDALVAGDIVAGQPIITVYKSSPDEWRMLSPGAFAASDTVVGGLEIAVQSEMEAAASAVLAVTPGRQHFHPGHPKAGGNFNGSGTPAFRSGDYGMGAITDNGAGDYTLALDTAFSNTDYWLTAFARMEAASTRQTSVSAPDGGTKTASSMQLTTRKDDNSVADPTEAGVSFWGDYA